MRRTVLQCWVLCALVLGPLTARAQTPAIPTIELDEAVRRALENNPTVAQAATAIARAEALLLQARAITRPTVSAGFVNTTLDGARGFAGGITQPQSQVAFSAEVGVPILSASRWAGIAQARDQIEVASLSVTEVRRQIAIAVAQTYLTVIVGHRQVEVDERALQSARAHLDYATKRLEGGAGSRLNQLRAAQLAAAAEARLESTRLALERSQEALGLIVAAEGPLDAASEPVFEPGQISAAAIAERPDVQFQAAVRRAAERVVRDSWKDLWPTAAASFAPQYITPSGLFQPARTWRLSISFVQPLYEGGQARAVKRLREVAVEQATFALNDVELRARSEVRIAEAAVRTLERSLTHARLAAEHAGEVLRITTTAFEVGATTNLEVIDAQRSSRDAETSATIAEDALRRARLDLLIALGRFPR
jgi:outer membrane protein TolC